MAVVTDRDLGLAGVIRNIERLNGTEIVAGMLSDSGNARNGASYVNVATWNEFGTGRIPSRPFLRIAFDDNHKAWESLAENLLDQVLDRCMSARQLGRTMGERMQKDIRDVIGDKSRLAPNAPSTIRRKGHDKPLIDTGTMKERVNYRVEGGSP